MDRAPRGGAGEPRRGGGARRRRRARDPEAQGAPRRARPIFVDIHVQADPSLTLAQAHLLGHQVKDHIQADLPQVLGALVHMEPYEGAQPPAGA